MLIAMAQIDPLIGDFSGNTTKILRFIEKAKEKRSDLVIFPELALMGYPPRDLLELPSFVNNGMPYLDKIREASRGIGVICGAATVNSGPGKPYHNSALFFNEGELLVKTDKRLLPSYDVFDEERYFEAGDRAVWVDFKGERLGITICEDSWNVKDYLPRPLYRLDPVSELKDASVSILVNIAASPYHTGKASWTEELLRSHATRHSMKVVFVNQVGGNDELIFHGHSLAIDEGGRVVASCADFKEDLVVYDTSENNGERHSTPMDRSQEIIEALTLGLRDYVSKCGFEKAVLGLSGGIDSALVACLARIALGPENVLGVGMPGPYNAPESLSDSEELASRLGIQFIAVPISEMFDASLRTLEPAFKGTRWDTAEENLQARLRGVILMALSNKFNRILLGTGNKSEVSVGYCTLYGDMNGGIAILGDVPKTMVYELARKLNEQYGWIPERTMVRPPSAELKPGQKDQDTLPPYDVLDRILSDYLEKRLTVEEIIAGGQDPGVVDWIVRAIRTNEYKRWQAPPILRVTTKAFGSGRRFPLAQGFRE